MKRVLLTGGTGFVGANLARTLLQEGHEVHLLVRPQYKPWRIEPILKDVRLSEVDLRDFDGLHRAVSAIRPEWIFHLAAYGAYPFQSDARLMVDTNLTGTINLVEACLMSGFEAFIHAGSSSEYGFKDHAPLESEVLEPNSLYAITKAASTHYCRHTARSSAQKMCTLRLYSVYGPFEEPSRLIPNLIVKGLEGRLPLLVGPQVGHDFVYVEDVCRAFLLVAVQPDYEPGAIYNIGGGIQVTLREVVETACRVMGIHAEPVWGSMRERKWDTLIWISNPEKIRTTTGWQPGYSFEAGLRAMLSWFNQNPAYIDFYKKAGELV